MVPRLRPPRTSITVIAVLARLADDREHIDVALAFRGDDLLRLDRA